jgi:hypothetical protein
MTDSIRIKASMLPKYFSINSRLSRAKYKDRLISDYHLNNVDDSNFECFGEFFATIDDEIRLRYLSNHPSWSITRLDQEGFAGIFRLAQILWRRLYRR